VTTDPANVAPTETTPSLAPQRIVIVGVTGSGKTTLGRRSAAVIGGRHIELDGLFHQANWTPAEPEVFRATLRAAIADQPRWVTDGGYRSLVSDITWPLADEIVWIDLPFRVTFPRMLRRTIGRRARNEELWNGNRESIRGMLFSRESLILFSIQHRNKYRNEYPAALSAPNLAHVRVSHLRSRAAVDAWLRRLKHDVNTIGFAS
jgi:adenylate kinase family enzyme